MVKKISRNRYIAIAGVMGSGKTTCAKILRQELGFPLLEEKPQENPFLEDFYKDMKRWALHSQLFYVLKKIQQNAKAKKLLLSTSVIQDAPFGQDLIYVKTNQKFGNIGDHEYRLIIRLMELYAPHMIRPDPLIVLDAPLDLILNRISARGRDYEQEVSKDYIAALLSFQKKWLAKYPRNKKIIIPIDKLNLKEKRHRDAFVKLIRRAL